MAGSRIERIGSIYSRVKGLINAGALKEADRPLWLSVYERFPPKNEPVDIPREFNEPVRNILYKEDLIRAKFHQQFGSVGVLDLTDQLQKPMSERFIERYNELEKYSQSEDLFESTVQSLKAEGYTLQSLEDIQKQQREKRPTQLKESNSDTAKEMDKSQPVKPLTAVDLFGKYVVEDEEEEY